MENINAEKLYVCSINMPYKIISNAKIIKIYDYQSKKGIFKILSYITSQRHLLRIIKKEKLSVIHFQWFKIPQLDLEILKRIKKIMPQVKIVHTAHNVLPHDSGSKYKKIYRKIYNFVDKIIVHVEITKTEICNEFNCEEGKIDVIPHGYLPSKFKLENTNDSFFTFSFIGFLSDYKGLDILLDVWCNTPAILNNEKCRLVIAGAGNLPCLNTIPNDKNIVLENYFHTDEELAKIVAETDVAVLPYRKISQSGVLLTFIAEHIPVIVSDIGGLTQPFEQGKIGWILEELLPDALKKVLLNVIENPDMVNSIKHDKLLWSKIDDFYDWKNIGEKTAHLYEELDLN
ncbi:MAG: glycosyltransferase family 4 protein [Treponema sp.]|nr:glycosyltransferase family 4 protein [Treponema sp.]